MKKVFLSMIIILQMLLTLLSASIVSADADGCIANSTFRELTSSQITCDLNGDGKTEIIRTEIEETKEESYYYLIISNKKYLVRELTQKTYSSIKP